MARQTLEQLYALTVPEIQEIFLNVMSDVVDRAILVEMVAAIEANDPEALFRASGFTPAVLAPIIDRIEQVYKEAADNEVEGWPRRIVTTAGIVQPIFDMRNPRAEQELREFSSQFITRATEEAKQNVRRALEEGLVRGDNPRQTALDIVGRVNPSTGKREGGIIGLADNQVQWSISARRYLEQGNDRYFSLALRDKRFDSTVRKAFESGKPLNKETISKLVTAYNNKALRYRAENVARTETMQALNRGERASIQQAIDEGTLVRQQVTKWWDDAGDGRVRHSHRQLALQYSKDKAIPFDEPFVTVTGDRLMQPGDTSLGADVAEVASCRCVARYKVDWRYGLDEDG